MVEGKRNAGSHYGRFMHLGRCISLFGALGIIVSLVVSNFIVGMFLSRHLAFIVQLMYLWSTLCHSALLLELRYGTQLQRKSFSTPKLCLFEFLARCSVEEATILAVTFLHLWDARNKLRGEGGNINPSSIAIKCIAYVDMIQTHIIQSTSIPRHATSVAVS
jgi:hypothetical protein